MEIGTAQNGITFYEPDSIWILVHMWVYNDCWVHLRAEKSTKLLLLLYIRTVRVFNVKLNGRKKTVSQYILCMCVCKYVSSVDIRFQSVSVLRAVCYTQCFEYTFSTAHNDHICLELFSLAVNETKIAEKDETTLCSAHIVGVVPYRFGVQSSTNKTHAD